MKKIIYVMSLSHSGSTLVDLTLSRHPRVTGLGEIEGVLRKRQRTQEGTELDCSCGTTMNSCPVWTQLEASLNLARPTRTLEKYRALANLPALAESEALVDSSKSLRHLERLCNLERSGDIKLFTIFLVRDARGWAKSVSRRHRKRAKRRRSNLYYLLRWYRHNRRIERFLTRRQIRFLPVGYEAFCFDTETTVARILDFAGIAPAEVDFDRPPNSHIAYGNRMKLNPQKRRSIIYDGAWLTDHWLNLVFLLIPRVFRWNKRHVY
ncbi:MAG: sulfotransferase [Gammaproteobacteria bacterium]